MVPAGVTDSEEAQNERNDKEIRRMRIAVPTDENNTQSGVCVSFGRAPYFLIYDTETKETEFIENSAANERGGAGIKAAQLVADCKVSVILTPRCGENSAAVTNAAGIKLYKTGNGTAVENIDAYITGKLAPLSDIHPGFHGSVK